MSNQQTDPLTNTLVALLAPHTTPLASRPAVVEECAGHYARVFMSGHVDSARLIMPGSTLSYIARQLILVGDVVLTLETVNSTLTARVVTHYSKSKDSYTVDYDADSVGSSARVLPASGVLHFKYALNPQQPAQRGIGPLYWSSTTVQALAAIEQVMEDVFTRGLYGSLLKLDGSTGDQKLREIADNVSRRRGETLFGDKFATPASESYGYQPDGGFVQVRKDLENSVRAACGIPPALFDSRTPGGASREALRTWLHHSCEPLALRIQEELRTKVEEPALTVRLETGNLTDVAAPARAFKAYRDAGLTITQAARLLNLDVDGGED